MIQSTLQQQSRWLRVGACSLALGLGSLFMAAGSAFAVPISATVSDTLTGGPFVVDDLDPNKGMAGDFIVTKQGSGSVGFGFDERWVGAFDFTSDSDWALFSTPGWGIESAIFAVTLDPGNGLLSTDSFWIGMNLTSDDDVLLPAEGGNSLERIFYFEPYSPGVGLPQVPVVEFSDIDTITIVVDLLDFYSANDLYGQVFGGDHVGGIYVMTGDDALTISASMELTAIQNPEPASLLLMGTGLVSMVAWRFRKNRQNQ